MSENALVEAIEEFLLRKDELILIDVLNKHREEKRESEIRCAEWALEKHIRSIIGLGD